MRNFFIGSFEKLVGLFIVLLGLGVVIAAVGAFVSPQAGGALAGVGILIGGALYLVLMGGMLYLFLGIHANTKRTAEAIEKLLERQ